jgi:hypothetical protein
MNTQLKICNEGDYLQAHLTFIVSKRHPGNAVFHGFKQRVTSMLKKWITVANADLTSLLTHLRGLRATEGGLAKRNEHRLIVQ